MNFHVLEFVTFKRNLVFSVKDASLNSFGTSSRFKALLQSANNNLVALLLNAANDEKLRSKCLAREFEGG